MKRIALSIAAVFMLGGMFAFVQLTSWTVAQDHSIRFSGKGVSGIFKTFNATITFDETNLSTAKFLITIDVASINTGNAMQNRHATGAEWFDAAKYPQIKFTSGTVEKSAAGYVVKGKMEVKGKTKDVAIPFTFSKSGAAGEFTSTLTIKRSDYGIGAGSNDVSDEIKVDVKVPVTKA
jgi:polyisoprenoid-binding protein YceI